MADIPQNEEFIKIIVTVVIAVVYTILAVVRKADKWIKEHRVPQTKIEEDQYHRPKPAPAPYRREPEPSPAEIIGTLLKEQRDIPDLRGVRQAPTPKPPSDLYAQPLASAKRASVPSLKSQMPPVAQPPVRAPASAVIVRRRLDHLRVIRSKSDLRRAVLLHEILSPPVSMRRRGGSLSPAVRHIA